MSLNAWYLLLPNYLFYLLRILVLTMHSLKNLLIVSYQNRMLSKTKCNSKQAGVQKDHIFFTPHIIVSHIFLKGFVKIVWKEKIVVQKIFLSCLQKSVLVGYVVCKNIIITQISNTAYLQA